MTDAETLADLSALIRDYLVGESDVTRPSFHATALTTAIASDWLAEVRAQARREALSEAADAYLAEYGTWGGASQGQWLRQRAGLVERGAECRVCLRPECRGGCL